MSDTKLLKTAFFQLLKEITPQKIVEKECSFDGKTLRIQNSSFDLDLYRNIYLFGSGKAVLPMAQSIQKMLKKRIKETFLIGAYENDRDLKNTIYMQSSHPIPSQKSIDSALKLKEKLENLTEDDLFIYLLSGGTSSLIEIPEADISIEDTQKTTQMMLKSAFAIDEMNCVRKHISQIKGGKLADKTRANGIVLVLSDVLGDNLQAIGSAPLYFDDTTFDDALGCLKKHDIFEKIPKSVQNFILEGTNLKQKETPKAEHKKIEHFVLASNQTVLKKAKEILEKKIETTIIEKPMKDEVLIETKRLLDFAKTKSFKRACYVFGGECTVKADKNGTGGRNQHLALSFLHGADFDFQVTLLCGATDGIDGNSDIAGAVVQTSKLSKTKKEEIREYLKKFDSSLYFQKAGGLIKTDPTHNNLLDIAMVIIK